MAHKVDKICLYGHFHCEITIVLHSCDFESSQLILTGFLDENLEYFGLYLGQLAPVMETQRMQAILTAYSAHNFTDKVSDRLFFPL